MRLELLWKTIQKKSLPFLDVREGDFGHASIVKSYAEFLSEYVPNAQKAITIPAAILHDIGWEKLEKGSIAYSRPDLTTKKQRIIHQVEGVLSARKILENVNYPNKYINSILDIILEHDISVNREEIIDVGYNKNLVEKIIRLQSPKDKKGFKSPSEGVVRDADKLWKYSFTGFLADCRRRGTISYQLLADEIKILENNYLKKDVFYLPISKQLAKKSLDLHCKMIKFLY